jgi:hypothetical protein
MTEAELLSRGSWQVLTDALIGIGGFAVVIVFCLILIALLHAWGEGYF